MPFFSCGAIPHSISSESPSEKMHAHQRSFSNYRKIVTKIDSKLYAILLTNRKVQYFRQLTIRLEIFKALN